MAIHRDGGVQHQASRAWLLCDTGGYRRKRRLYKAVGLKKRKVGVLCSCGSGLCSYCLVLLGLGLQKRVQWEWPSTSMVVSDWRRQLDEDRKEK